MEQLNYADQRHAEQTERINADIQREAARKAEATEAKEHDDESAPVAVEVEQGASVKSTPAFESDEEKQRKRQRENEDWARAQREAKETREAAHDEANRQRYQVREAERVRREAEFNTPERVRAREELQAALDAEVERQERLLVSAGDWSYAANDGKSRKEVATRLAHAALKERAAEAAYASQPVDLRLEQLRQRVLSLEARLSAAETVTFRIRVPELR